MVSHSIMGLSPSFMLIWDKPRFILAVSLLVCHLFSWKSMNSWRRKTTKFYSPTSGAELDWELRDKLPMGKTEKRTNHHNRINNFMAWEALNWHSNNWTSSHRHLNEKIESFDVSLCHSIFICDQLITHPLQHHKGCQGASPQCKTKSSSTKRLSLLKRGFNLLLCHLKFRQATITGPGSYHVRGNWK